MREIKLFNKDESKIHMIILCGILILLAFAIAAGYCGAFSFDFLKGLKNVKDREAEIISLEKDTSALDDMSKRVNEVKVKFERLRYSSRNTLREQLNKELTEHGFSILALTAKDFVGDSKRKSSEGVSNNGIMVVSVKGEVAPENILSFINFVNSSEHLWFLTEMQIECPEGIEELWGETFMRLTPEQKQEAVNHYKEISAGHGLSVTMEFLISVR